jgi:murein DD-endopeptidase MepM/ murein hydrolase activator NlpD
LALLMALVASPAMAGKDRDELEKERQSNLEKLDKLGEQLEDVTKEMKDAFLELERTKANLPSATAKVADANAVYTKSRQRYDSASARLVSAQSQQTAIQDQIHDSESKAAQSRAALGQMARQTMLQSGPAETDLMLLLGAADLEDLAAQSIAAEAVTRTRTELLKEAQEEAAVGHNNKARLDAVAVEIDKLKDVAAQAMKDAERDKQDAEAARDALEALIASNAKAAADLEHQKVATQQQQQELQQANKNIASELKKIADAEHVKAPGGGAPKSPGMFGPPLSSLTVTSPFGYRIHPILHTRRLHTGTDFTAGCGASIFATADGTVISTYYQSAWGNRTEINHGVIGGKAIASSYNHQSAFLVSPGDHVTKGQLIGKVGTTGWSTGCHLHFEIFEDGTVVDPMTYL